MAEIWKKSIPYLKKELFVKAAGIFEINDCLPAQKNKFDGTDYPLVLRNIQGDLFQISLWQKDVNKLIDAFQTEDTAKWIGKFLTIKAEIIPDKEGKNGKPSYRWAISPSSHEGQMESITTEVM